jgi:beta-glucanase (GH16 family)
MMLSAKNYKGAEYRTHEEFLYGRFDVRYKPANREGVVSSFFTYHEIEDSTGWNEIDLEFIGRYNNTLQLNVITPGQQFHIRSQHLLFDPYSDFHEYSFEWTPDYVAWFIDGAEVYRQSGEHISLLRYHQKIMMNIWNPVFTNWVGYFDDSYLPAVSVYDLSLIHI